VLLPLVFCRECGQEYYCVRVTTHAETNDKVFIPRDLFDRLSGEEGEAGFLYFGTTAPWPSQDEEVLKKLPDGWLEEHRGGIRVRAARRRDRSRPSVPVNPLRQQTRHFCELVHRMMVRPYSLPVCPVSVVRVNCEFVVAQTH